VLDEREREEREERVRVRALLRRVRERRGERVGG
jgi:hypothetical protein